MSDIFKDYYAILDISRQATSQEIRFAYHLMSKKYHPDKNPDKDMTTKMQDINEAYFILKDEQRRSLYDIEYTKFQKSSKIKESDDLKYYYNYNIEDENLKKNINAAQMYAEKLVEEFFRSLKVTTKIAAKNAWEGIRCYHNQRKQPARREILREARSWEKDGCGV